MKKIVIVLSVLFVLLVNYAFAETISGFSLGDNIDVAIKKLGKPVEKKVISKTKTSYLWGKPGYDIRMLTWDNKIFFIKFNTNNISINKGLNGTATSKGVRLGDSGGEITKNYGDGSHDYQYESEDCGVVNFKTGKKEHLVFRVYQGGDVGRIIDIILCRPGFSKDAMWE